MFFSSSSDSLSKRYENNVLKSEVKFFLLKSKIIELANIPFDLIDIYNYSIDNLLLSSCNILNEFILLK